MIYDYSIPNSYNLFVIEWVAPAPLRVMGALSSHVKRVNITKEGLVCIEFQSYSTLPAEIRETVDKADLLRSLILYLPKRLVEINHQGEPQAFIEWQPSGAQGSQRATFKSEENDEFELIFMCDVIQKRFLRK